MNDNLSLSDAGLDALKHEEGYVGHVYLDQVGKPTIGYGHLIRSGEDFSDGLTVSEAGRILRQNVRSSEMAVRKAITYALAPHEFDALVSLCFNIGNGRFASSRCVLRLNALDVGGVSGDPHALDSYTGAMREWAEFRIGTKKNGERVTLPVLVARRAREIRRYLTGR
jgi:lysozyme